MPLTGRGTGSRSLGCIIRHSPFSGLLIVILPSIRPKIKPVKPIEPLPEMMAGQRKLYTEIKDGILDKTWEEAATSAWILAEIANANQYQNDDKDYRKFAGRLSKEAATLAKQLKKQDERGAKETVARIGRTCKACHEQFKKD